MSTDYIYLLVAVTPFFFCLFLICFCKYMRRYSYAVPARDTRKGHHWCTANMFTQPTYCCISESHIIHGMYCDTCGVCVADRFVREADKRLRCKDLARMSEGQIHHWIKGNLPLCSRCVVCHEQCGHLPKLCDFRCCWCGRAAHERCIAMITEVCDFGKFSTFVIPPSCLTLKLVGVKGRRRYVVASVKKAAIPHWSPLIVIANKKSGNGDGEHVLQAFRCILNPAQVIDLSEQRPENALEWCHLLPDVTCRILIGGGDGTVGWVLAAIDKLNLKCQPLVAILPLGTGNDLSRVLGWGEGHVGEVDAGEIMDKLTVARTVHFDRWQVNIVPQKHFGIRLPKKKLIMNNYASIGVDALVALNFHRHREYMPGMFGNRWINRFWYFMYGTKDVLERECKDLHLKLKLELDGKEISLPAIEGIVVLNIASWGGGCRPWLSCLEPGEQIPTARYDDGLLEVFAPYSSFHIAQLQAGLAKPLRLGQAHTVKITLFGGNAPMQVDGEPWEQHPAVITISYHNNVLMLSDES